MDFKYYFSVVIPVYNVEAYLEETIQSVISQDIGFQEHIQLILVNDGSPDNSEAICLKYRELYPDNVVYLCQENAGVSAARNAGFPYIQGKYVNFLDSDDKWAPDVFSQVYRFFEKNYKKIDAVACKMEFFEARTGDHPLDYKFHEDEPERIIDLLNNYQDIHCHTSSTIFKTEALGEIRFDCRLKYGEDTVFLNNVILPKHSYGALTNAVHYYRKRANGSSAVQTQGVSPSWYFDSPKYYLEALAERCIQIYGSVLPYIQHVLFYDMGYRLKIPLWEDLSDQEREDYVAQLTGCLKRYVSDFVILKHNSHPIEIKLLALKLKYGELDDHVMVANQTIYFDNHQLVSLSGARWVLRMTNLEIRENQLCMEGLIRKCVLDLLGKPYRFYFRAIGVASAKASCRNLPVQQEMTLFGPESKFVHFKAVMPLEPSKTYKIKPMLLFRKMYKCRFAYVFGSFCPLDQRPGTYCRFGKYLVEYDGNYIVVSAPQNMRQALWDHELALEKQLKQLGYGHLNSYRRQALLLKLWQRKTKKRIWLISDRAQVAGDNGEAFFKYLCKSKPKNIVPYFVIDQDCPDYQRMKQYGRVIPLNSKKNLVYTLAADKIIGSNGSHYTFDPFGKEKRYVKDLMRSNYVFLQHGITLDDVSGWLNKTNKNIRLFITASKREQASIATRKYGYSSEVVLTGFARYDTLIERGQSTGRKKQIAFLPTWRKSFQKLPPADPELAITAQNEGAYRLHFKETQYYQFYNALINHPRLLEAMRTYGYTGLFGLHPMINSQWKDFQSNDLVKIYSGYLDYSGVLAESAILLTDYSSVCMDFGYLRRPVVYAQFDEDTFFQEHTRQRGYFDYREDGFGPVCTDLESTVDALIRMMENGGELDPVYLERINSFFAYDDAKNCQRILKAIKKMK